MPKAILSANFLQTKRAIGYGERIYITSIKQLYLFVWIYYIMEQAKKMRKQNTKSK